MDSGMIFVTFTEAVPLLAVTESELDRLVREGEIRAFRTGNEMKFRLTDLCDKRRSKFLPRQNPPNSQFFGANVAAMRIGVTFEGLMTAVSCKLVPLGMVSTIDEDVPEPWIEFWRIECERNSDRWQKFLHAITSRTEGGEGRCIHGVGEGAPCDQCRALAEAEADDVPEDEIVGASEGYGRRPTGCVIGFALLVLKLGSGVAVGALLASRFA